MSLSQDDIAGLFKSGLNCAQIVLGYQSEKLGISTEDAHRIASAFGGGMMRGETCGALTGAYLALGLSEGYSGDAQEKSLFEEKQVELTRHFESRCGSIRCKELLGRDISNPQELQSVIDEGLFFSQCPRYVLEAINLLDQESNRL